MITLHFGEGANQRSQEFVVRADKDKPFVHFYSNVLATGFSHIKDLPENEAKREMVKSVLETIASQNNHFSVKGLDGNRAEQQFSDLNQISSQIEALRAFKEKNSESGIIQNEVDNKLQALIEPYKLAVLNSIRTYAKTELVGQEKELYFEKLAEQAAYYAIKNGFNQLGAYEYAKEIAENPQKILGNDKANDKENKIEEQGMNASLKLSEKTNNEINNIGISTITLEEVHNKELVSRQQAVENTQDNVNQLGI